MIEDVFIELKDKAEKDRNGCFGYFPAMVGTIGIDHNLPACRTMSEFMPTVEVDQRPFHFNFIRLSLIRQHGSSSFHLDTDAGTALTGSPQTMQSRLVSRLLLNLSSAYARSLSFVNIDPGVLRLRIERGYLHSDAEFSEESIETVTIPPREENRLHGLLLASNKVLHSGKDDEHGHFLMAFGREDPR